MRHIDHRGERPADTILIRLLRCETRGLFDQVGIPGSPLPQRDRVDRLIAVNHIARSHQRNTQTGLFHRHSLQAVDLFGANDIED